MWERDTVNVSAEEMLTQLCPSSGGLAGACAVVAVGRTEQFLRAVGHEPVGRQLCFRTINFNKNKDSFNYGNWGL